MWIENRTPRFLLIQIPDKMRRVVDNPLEQVEIHHAAFGRLTVTAAVCPPESPTVRVRAVRDPRMPQCGVPVTARRWEPCRKSMELPHKKAVLYVVTKMALQAYPGRFDVVSPAWGDRIRTIDGRWLVTAFLSN